MKPKRLPMQPNPHKTPTGTELSGKDVTDYRHHVGELMWLANMTRPDLAYSAGFLARHLQVPTSAHQDQLEHTLAYLSGTKGYVLTLGRQTDDPLLAYSDSDWATEAYAKRKSVGGYISSR
jgi:hypothetical protein